MTQALPRDTCRTVLRSPTRVATVHETLPLGPGFAWLCAILYEWGYDTVEFTVDPGEPYPEPESGYTLTLIATGMELPEDYQQVLVAQSGLTKAQQQKITDTIEWYATQFSEDLRDLFKASTRPKRKGSA